MAVQKVQDIFETMDNQETRYDDAFTQLTNYFKPRKIIAFKRHIFHKSKQTNDTTIDNYIVRLKQVAFSCEFTDQDENIRDKVVNSCNSNYGKNFLKNEN